MRSQRHYHSLCYRPLGNRVNLDCEQLVGKEVITDGPVDVFRRDTIDDVAELVNVVVADPEEFGIENSAGKRKGNGQAHDERAAHSRAVEECLVAADAFVDHLANGLTRRFDRQSGAFRIHVEGDAQSPAPFVASKKTEPTS